MRKKITSALLIFSTVMLIAGCGKTPANAPQNESDTTADSPTGNDNSDDSSSDTGNASDSSSGDPDIDIQLQDFPDAADLASGLSDFPTEEGMLLSVNGNANDVTIINNEGDIIYSDSYSDLLEKYGLSGIGLLENAIPVCYDRGALIVEKINNYNGYNYEFWAVFPQSNDANYIMVVPYSPKVTTYNDMVYITYLDPNTNGTCEIALSQDADSCDYYEVSNKEMASSDGTWYTYPVHGKGTPMCVTETLDTCGYFISLGNDNAYMVDNDGNIKKLPFYSNKIDDYDSNYIVGVTDVDGLNEYCIYDIENDVFNAIVSTYEAVYLGYSNGCLYYSVRNYSDVNTSIDSTSASDTSVITTYGSPTYDIMMYCIYDNSKTLLFNSRAYVGLSDIYTCGEHNEMYILGSNIFYTDYNGTTGNWFKCTGSEDGYSTTDTGVTVFTYDWTDYGSIENVSHLVNCPYCGTMVSKFTSEYLVISDSYSCADAINNKIMELTDEHFNNFSSYSAVLTKDDCDYDHLGDGSYYYSPSTEEWSISSAELLSGHYLAINISGYCYAGGAHGMPYEDQYLFDLNTGDYIEFSDLYEGTEDELKEIVAEATKQNCEEIIANGEYSGCSPYYSDDSDEVYEEAYELVSLDSVSFEFTEEGVRVVYAPYDMGPFASGFIYVTVPYEDLGITLFN